MSQEQDGTADAAALDTQLDPAVIAGEADDGADAVAESPADGEDASEAAADAGAVEVAAAAEGGDEPEGPKRKPWWEERIDRLTREKNDLKRELQGRSETKPAEGETAPRTYTEDEVREMVAKAATSKAGEDALLKACNDLFDKGVEAHKDGFLKARDSLMKAMGEQLVGRPDFLEALTELPNGHEVYYHLGNDLDHAAELMALSPARMAVKLSQISADLAKPRGKPVSAAPAPITPVRGGAKTELDITDPDLDMAEFVRRRNAQDPRFVRR